MPGRKFFHPYTLMLYFSLSTFYLFGIQQHVYLHAWAIVGVVGIALTIVFMVYASRLQKNETIYGQRLFGLLHDGCWYSRETIERHVECSRWTDYLLRRYTACNWIELGGTTMYRMCRSGLPSIKDRFELPVQSS